MLVRTPVIVLALLWAVAPLSAQDTGSPRPMTYEDVVGIRVASDPRISPDREHVVFVVREWDKANDSFNQDLYLVRTSDRSLRRLTHQPKRDAVPRWSPDGRSIAFVSVRDERPQIYLLPVDGGEARQLTNHGTAISTFQWSPDGESIFFLAPVPDPDDDASDEEKAKPVIVVDEDMPYAHVWRLNLETKAVEQISEGDYHVGEAKLSPDGMTLALTIRPSTGITDLLEQEVAVMPAAGGELRWLTQNGYIESSPRWSPDSKWLAYLRATDGNPVSGPSRIHIRAVSGEGEPRVLAPNFDGYIRDYRWSVDGANLIFFADHRVNRHIYTITADGGEPMQITQGDGLHGVFTLDRSGHAGAWLQEDPEHPARYCQMLWIGE